MGKRKGSVVMSLFVLAKWGLGRADGWRSSDS